MLIATVEFPSFTGVRCLMMPYIQGDPLSVPDVYAGYRGILESVAVKKGDIGFLTIDESPVAAGKPHRASRAKFPRAIHTEAGIDRSRKYHWGGGGWGATPHRVELERDVRVLIGSNLDDSCAVWGVEHEDTSSDGDIGHEASKYPLADATLLKAGEIHAIGILTPHESLPVRRNLNRQFIRIVSSGVHGREEYFTRNPLVPYC